MHIKKRTSIGLVFNKLKSIAKFAKKKKYEETSVILKERLMIFFKTVKIMQQQQVLKKTVLDNLVRYR